MSNDGGFSDGITGGAGSLRIPQIQSPNYEAGVSGWAIFRNGNVEFNSGTFRGVVTGGAFDGTDFIINPLGMFFYSGTPALGNLIASITPAAGANDGVGNAFLGPGLTIYGSTGQSVFATLFGGLPELIFHTGASIEGSPGNIAGGISGAGVTEYLAMVLSGPKLNSAGAVDWVQIELFSDDPGVTTGALGVINYIDIAAVVHEYAFWGAGGFTISAGTLTAVDPTTGTPAAPAIPETWHTVAFQNSWSNAAARTPTNYRLIAAAPKCLQICGSLTAPAGLAAGQTVFTLPAGYIPATVKSVIGRNQNTNAPVIFTLSNTGAFQYQSGAVATNPIDLSDIILPLDI